MTSLNHVKNNVGKPIDIIWPELTKPIKQYDRNRKTKGIINNDSACKSIHRTINPANR